MKYLIDINIADEELPIIMFNSIDAALWNQHMIENNQKVYCIDDGNTYIYDKADKRLILI